MKKPEYFFRPSQALRRLRRIGHPPQAVELVKLPWGAMVEVHVAENVGSDIFHYGIFDRIIPEAIYRLAVGGETVLEVGANIGQNCSLLARKVGPAGRVIAFEPHPEIFAELTANANRWDASLRACLQLENVALGASDGEAWLADGPEFQHNRGSAAICDSAAPAGRRFKVRLRRVDDYISKSATVGVCKIDVEGHELSVLQGATEALSRHAIRDIIFEDFNPMPSPVTRLLQARGFTVFQLVTGWLKPSLVSVREGVKPPKDFSSNYLATLAPRRAMDRFRAPGWRCLTGH